MVSPWEIAAPLPTRALLPEHEETLTVESGISLDVVKQRGYYSLNRDMVNALVQLEAVNPVVLSGDSWMGIPTVRPDGTVHAEVLRVFGDKAKVKYVWPTGVRNSLDVNPDALADLADTSVPIIFTEGIKKADAILSAARAEGFRCVVIAVNGCWGWKQSTEGGSVASFDFMDIPLSDRRVYVVSDSDFRTNDNVRAGWSACAQYISSKTGEHRTFVVVVPPDGLDKVGADDYLVHGGTLSSLLGHASSPAHALLDVGTESRPLLIKTGLQVIAEAGKEVPHLLAPLLPERSIVVLAGHSGTYKTWHALGLMLDGAFGLPWLDHPELKMRDGGFTTLYVNKEMGGIMLATNLKLLSKNPRYRDSPDYEKLVTDRVFSTDEAELDLALPAQRDRLEEALLAMKVDLVVLDSLSMCWSGNEDSNSEVGALYAKMRGITERVGVTWLVLHHLLKPSPSGSASRLPAKFTVRGAGQIIQQADSALLFAPHNENSGDPDVREIKAEFVKTRTDREPPEFISQFKTNDGLFISVEFGGKVMDVAAKAYAESGGDPIKFAAWFNSTLTAMPAMHPTGSGMRSKQLYLLLQAAWPVGEKTPPSERTLQRRIEMMTEMGQLVMLEESKKHGNLYRFPEEVTVPAPTTPLPSPNDPPKPPEV